MALPDSPAIRVESDGPVRVVTLNRPETMNAFDREMHAEFPRVLADLGHDREARAVVLTGAGRAFSAGGDISNFAKNKADLYHRRASLREARRMFDELISLHLPVVAAVNGPAVGLGCTVATACDIVFMAETAFFADPHVTVALVAGDGGAITWPALTSLLKAKQYLLTGDRMPGARGAGHRDGQLRRAARGTDGGRHRLRTPAGQPAAAGRPGHQAGAEPAAAGARGRGTALRPGRREPVL